jgi:hypothetical protein
MLEQVANKRLVTRVWLMAELNERLRRAERLDPGCCGCRVKQLSPLEPGGRGGANWAAELFDIKCEGRCLDQVMEIVSQLQQNCDVAW